MGSPFKFKHFEIRHDRSTMKVGTDAIVLGSWLTVDPDCKSILDVGTGSGVIALALAQRTMACVDAIDIDEASVVQATLNFGNSPWSDRMSVMQVSLNDYNLDGEKKYDLIVSNPPFFQNGLLPQSPRLQIAKHNVALTMGDFVENMSRLLSEKGKWAVIIPADLVKEIRTLADKAGFSLSRQLQVFPKEGKAVKRCVLVFDGDKHHVPEIESINIRNKNGNFSAVYIQLTREYHPEGYL